MKVLVTGGGGFLGTAICKMLVQRGDAVVSISRKSYPHLIDPIKQIQVDISEPQQLDKLETDFDAIIHTAGKVGVWGDEEVYNKINYEGTRNLILWAQKHNVKAFIHTSSPSAVFGNHSLEGVDESTSFPRDYLCAYPKTKAKAEALVLNAHSESFRTCALRPHLIWGPGDANLIPRLIEKRKKNKLKRIGNGLNKADVIYIDNAAHAHLLALDALMEGNEQAYAQAFFIGQERPVNIWEFIDQLLVSCNQPPVHGQISAKLAYRVGGICESIYRLLGKQSEPPMTRFLALQLSCSHYFSHEKAKRILGYHPLVSIEEGLRRLEESHRPSVVLG